jgi:hypothetical protein
MSDPTCCCSFSRNPTRQEAYWDEDKSWSSSLGKMLRHPFTLATEAVGIVASVGFFATEEGLVHLAANATHIAEVVGIGTPPWITMVVVGGACVGLAVTSAIAYGCTYCECSPSRYHSDSLIMSSSEYTLTGLSSYGDEGRHMYTYELLDS